jgi:sulfur relay protein TusB/DsrH
MLHTLNALPNSPAWCDCFKQLTAEDTLVLMGDAVYAAADHNLHSDISSCPADCFVLTLDAQARGITPAVTTLNIEGLVELSEQHAQQLAWY